MKLYLVVEGYAPIYELGSINPRPTPKELADFMRDVANQMELWGELAAALG